MSELAFAFNLSERELRKQILTERNQGALICSGSSGYYLPADDKEIDQFIQMKKKSIFSSWSAIAPALKAQKIDTSQMTIEQFLQLKKEQP